MPRRGGVQFRLRWPARLRELSVVPPADTCYELSGRHGRGASRDRFLHLRDRERSFDAPALMAGIDAGTCVVNVGIKQARDDGASAQVDAWCPGIDRGRLADSHNAPV